MAACEACWDAAFLKSRLFGGSQVDHYQEELRAHPEHEEESHG